MLGRRGPAQAAFTPPELQELGELAGADVVVDPGRPRARPGERRGARGRPRHRAPRTTTSCASTRRARRRASRSTLMLRFCVSPVAILGEGRVEAIEVVRNELVAGDDGQIRAVPTDELEMIPCGIVLRSVGYRGVALPGLPFHEARGVIPNEGGRVVGDDGEVVPGVYVAGWIKRGPSGVIGTNKQGRDRDGRAAARGRARRACSRATTARPSSRACCSSAAWTSSSTRRWEAIDRARAGARRAARPPARQARDAGTSCSSAPARARRAAPRPRRRSPEGRD